MPLLMASTAQEALFENEPVGQIKSTTPPSCAHKRSVRVVTTRTLAENLTSDIHPHHG